MYKVYRAIPNIITLGNLFCGCCAVVFFLQSGEIFVQVNAFDQKIVRLPPQLWWGCFFVFLATVFDFFDGFAARLLKVPSELGKQLDSLADVVSFGVAPSMVFFVFLRMAWGQEWNGLEMSWFVFSPAFILACASAYRLATFNLDTQQAYHFIGMPTPAMALFVVSLPFCYWFNAFGIGVLLLNQWVLYGLVVVLSLLMVTNSIYFLSLKIRVGQLKSNLPALSVMLVFAVTVVLYGWVAIFLTWVYYVLLSLSMQRMLKKVCNGG